MGNRRTANSNAQRGGVPHIDHVFITDTAAISVNEFAADDDSGLGSRCGDERGLDHNVLAVDLDVRCLLGIGADKKESAATKRRAAIKYSGGGSGWKASASTLRTSLASAT